MELALPSGANVGALAESAGQRAPPDVRAYSSVTEMPIEKTSLS